MSVCEGNSQGKSTVFCTIKHYFQTIIYAYFYIKSYLPKYVKRTDVIQGVPGGIVNILGGGSLDYSE